MGNKVGQLRGATSNYMAYCKTPHTKGRTKGTVCNSWSLRPIFYPIDKASIIADCLDDQFRAHDFYNCDHRRHAEAKFEALLATVDEDATVNFRPCAVSK
jgi:hypothetical protein